MFYKTATSITTLEFNLQSLFLPTGIQYQPPAEASTFLNAGLIARDQRQKPIDQSQCIVLTSSSLLFFHLVSYVILCRRGHSFCRYL
jgi:hypothetical protein